VKSTMSRSSSAGSLESAEAAEESISRAQSDLDCPPVARGGAQRDSRLKQGMCLLGGRLRKARGYRYTVEELASLAGVSSGFISQIERGLANPSFGTLVKLAGALDIPLGVFFEGPSPRGGVVRKGKRRRIDMPGDLVYELLSPDLQHNLAMILTVVPAGFDNSDSPRSHPGDECVHVLEGSLEVHSGSSSVRLETGDTITYDSSIPHWWRNPSDSTTRVMGAVSPPSF